MKALVYHGNKDLRLEEIPEPQPGPGEVKLRIDHCGICATDIEEYLYGPNFIAHGSPNPITGRTLPLVTGHEITGTVVQTGDGVSNVGPGDRVALNTVLTCQHVPPLRRRRGDDVPGHGRRGVRPGRRPR